MRRTIGKWSLGLVLGCLLAASASVRGQVDMDDERAQVLAEVRREPLRAESFVQLATWLFRTSDTRRAVDAAEEATRLEPTVARHYRLLGYLLAANGAEHDAEAAFQRAAELDPAVRVSLADFHVARAWAEYQDALRQGASGAGLEERLRGLAAAGEVAPELKTLLRSRWTLPSRTPAMVVPPILLGSETPYALVVEKQTQTLRLYGQSGGELVLLQTYPCTTGQELGPKHQRDDRRTPDGVYVVTDLLAGSRLPNLYGALALPLNYPNAWDKHMHRRGYGIWLHGSDRLGAPFSPRDTRGCVLLRNEDLAELARLVVPGQTPILIAEDVPYRPAAEWKTAARQLVSQMSVSGLIAVVAAQDYTVVMHQEGASVMRDFVQTDPAPQIVVSERSTVVTPDDWSRKIASVLPDKTATLLGVKVLDQEQPPTVVIETSGPAAVRNFRAEIADRLYFDLLGVRLAPMPFTVPGNGNVVKEVRVAPADFDPPAARVAIDLRQPMKYQIANEGNRIVVSLSVQ